MLERDASSELAPKSACLPRLLWWFNGPILKAKGSSVIALLVYAAALVVVILHFTKFWANRNMEWVVLAAPAVVFLVNYLDYINVL